MDIIEARYKVTFSIREAVGWETKFKTFETKDDAKAFAQSLFGKREYAAVAVTDIDGNPIEVRHMNRGRE